MATFATIAGTIETESKNIVAGTIKLDISDNAPDGFREFAENVDLGEGDTTWERREYDDIASVIEAFPHCFTIRWSDTEPLIANDDDLNFVHNITTILS